MWSPNSRWLPVCLNKKKRNFVEFLIKNFLWGGLLSSTHDWKLGKYTVIFLINLGKGEGGGLICPANVCCLMHDIRNRKVPSITLNLFSDTTSIIMTMTSCA